MAERAGIANSSGGRCSIPPFSSGCSVIAGEFSYGMEIKKGCRPGRFETARHGTAKGPECRGRADACLRGEVGPDAGLLPTESHTRSKRDSRLQARTGSQNHTAQGWAISGVRLCAMVRKPEFRNEVPDRISATRSLVTAVPVNAVRGRSHWIITGCGIRHLGGPTRLSFNDDGVGGGLPSRTC